MGFPRFDFSRLTERLSSARVPARPRFLTGLSDRFGVSHGLSVAGGLSLPYKIAVVAVMMLVAGGTLVTFGSAGAETAPLAAGADDTTTASVGSVIPGTAEPAPRVEGQVIPDLPDTTYDLSPGGDTSILSADDLLSSLKLTDYSPKSNSNDNDDNKKKSDNDDDNKKSDDKKNSSTKKPSTKPTSKPTQKPDSKPTKGPDPKPSDKPDPQPTKEPEKDSDDKDDDKKEGGKHKNWSKCMDHNKKATDGVKKLLCGKEPDFED